MRNTGFGHYFLALTPNAQATKVADGATLSVKTSAHQRKQPSKTANCRMGENMCKSCV